MSILQKLALKFLLSKGLYIFLENHEGIHLLTKNRFRVSILPDGTVEDPDLILDRLLNE